MLVKAVYDVANHDDIDKVRIHFILSAKGYYCTIEGTIRLDQEFLGMWRRECARWWRWICRSISGASIRTMPSPYSGQHGMHDKERLFEYRRVSRLTYI